MELRAFICYRPGAGTLPVQLIKREIKKLFQPGEWFLDEEHSRARYFVRGAGLRDTSVVLLVIGPGWLEAEDDNGRKALFDQQDFVRFTVATALKKRVPIIPVLVDGARAPQPDELPDDLRPIASLVAYRFPQDVRALHAAIVTQAHRFSEPPLVMAALRAAPRAAPPREPVRQDLDATTFAPSHASGGSRFLIQCWLHHPSDFEFVSHEARKADPSAVACPTTPMTLFAERGSRVEVRIESDGLQITELSHSIDFSGRPAPLFFIAGMPRWPARSKFFVTIRFFQRSIPIGRSTFRIERGKTVDSQTSPARIKPYRHAFLSYASSDRVRVLEIAQAFSRTGTEVFQDVLSLEPGDRWQQELFKKIDYADLFMLFWSNSAKNSEWVIREAEYALARRDRLRNRSPDIVPYILEGPPVPLPPQSLSELHFNDPIRSVITAEQRSREFR